ncbi:putative protein arginine N-methyltransferase 3 [Apostichopus japonicus]|uniref:type I protein arginine methyltransferase n=1 Tax=Stichopus japonicus TaxID=307972 RepID=A0A2G8JZ13_STIJA|nr:putative protein arginine N-methyltransferase 3 [Apostichopus japonicus]
MDEENPERKLYADEEDEDDDAWEEMEGDGGVEGSANTNEWSSKCLFCPEWFASPQQTFGHCKEVHDLDIIEVHRCFGLDCISYIKLINYIRSKGSPASDITQCCWENTQPWDDDKFMQPASSSDALLVFDIESHLEAQGHMINDRLKETVSKGLTPEEHQELLDRLRAAEQRTSRAEEALARSIEDLNKMRALSERLLHADPETDTNFPLKQRNVADDNAYFDSYAHHSIHLDMLKDSIRTASYRDFILQNQNIFKNKVVLDVGCGTGILSMFAAKAGAKQVIAVDQSEIIYQAMDIVRENKLEDKITFVKGRLEDKELPVDKVDIIISEWMGYFLLFESMLDTVLYARDKHLVEGGVVYPDLTTISLVALGDMDTYTEKVKYWDNVYGFKMSCMRTPLLEEASVSYASSEHVMSEPAMIKCIDVTSTNVRDLDFTTDFKLVMSRTDTCTALVGYFDVIFERNCTKTVMFSTGPRAPDTHWKQTVFYLKKPIELSEGEVLTGRISCRKDPDDCRSLIVTFDIEGETLTYYVR